MKIYFACSITGGRQHEAAYQQFVKALLQDGHNVPSAMIAGPGWTPMEDLPDPGEVYHRDAAWIEQSQALVAEVSTPSHGVGYEIGYALQLGKAVLCLSQRGVRVSKMLTGNDRLGLQVADYEDVEQGIAIMREFLSSLQQ